MWSTIRLLLRRQLVTKVISSYTYIHHSSYHIKLIQQFYHDFLYSLQNNVCVTSNTSFLAVFCLHKVTKNTPSLDCPQLGVLYVYLHRAEGIAHGDPGESVDPNVRVYLNNQQVIY